jgi:hypothetical protein
MKLLTGIATVTTIACVAIALIQKDWTEAMAWLIVVLYNVQNFIHALLNDK